MSHVKHQGNRIIAPKDQFKSSLNDEDNFSGSSLAGETVLKKGPWTSLEDAILLDYVKKHGKGNWNDVRKHTVLSRCGKSCRLRWANHLRPDLKKGAFTHEEENMIIHLHSKLGNKWAQMAACLPGRTDNEIKNYWNTRVKKQQRAGLPLYPQHALLEASNENLRALNNNSMCKSGDKRGSDVLQGGLHDFLDVLFDPFKENPGPLSFSSPFSDLSFTGLQNQALESRTYNFNHPGMNCAKKLRGSESYFPRNHGSMASGHTMFEQLPHCPDSVNKNLLYLGYSKPYSLIQLNDNFSTSRPLTGTVKLELPSLQYFETDCCSQLTYPPAPPYEAIHTYIQPPRVAVFTQSDCASPSSGLLETLVQESHAISTARKQSSEKMSNYSAISPSDMPESSTANMYGADWEGSSDPNSPFCRSAVSPFSECAPINNSSLNELPDLKGPLGLKMTEPSVEQISAPNALKKDFSNWLHVLSPDALLGSGWFTGASGEPQW